MKHGKYELNIVNLLISRCLTYTLFGIIRKVGKSFMINVLKKSDFIYKQSNGYCQANIKFSQSVSQGTPQQLPQPGDGG